MNKMHFLWHLAELRKRLLLALLFYFIAVAGSYCFIEQIYWFLAKPLLQVDSNLQMIYTSLGEVFFTYLQLSLYSGFVFAFPLIAWQIYGFIAPGLYREEKIVLLPYLLLSPLLFLFGAFLAYYYVIPLAWSFFLGFSNPYLQLTAKVSEYLALVVSLIIGFGLAFQLPIILVLCCQLHLLSSQQLRDKRRHAIVVMFIIAAILTPPDVVSQVVMAVPLLLLYEVSIVLCKWIEKKRHTHDRYEVSP